MRELHTALDKLKFDSRMTQWNVSNGKLTQQELDNHLSSLEDLSSRCIKVELEDEKPSSSNHNDGFGNEHMNGGSSYNY